MVIGAEGALSNFDNDSIIFTRLQVLTADFGLVEGHLTRRRTFGNAEKKRNFLSLRALRDPLLRVREVKWANEGKNN
jgi:hypothetical protein